jgi:tetratricopeptide (TPR) repeat protein/TolB-like protein
MMHYLKVFSRIIPIFLFAFLFFASAGVSAQSSRATDTIMILPFENTSNQPSYNWVGESFAEAITELLARPELKVTGLRVVSNDERKQVQQKLRLPLTTLPSLATSIKIAQRAAATHLVLGKYSVQPGQGSTAAEIRFTARVININDGTAANEVLPNGRIIVKEINLGDALGELQKLQGQAVYQILYQRDKALSLSQNEVVDLAKQVPPVAFEAYVKGKLTSETDALRANYFRNALRLYADAKNSEVYPQAALELGHFYRTQNAYADALENFSRVPRSTPQYVEAAFYTGLMQWNLKNEEGALASFRQLADEARLTIAYNNVGAIAMQMARDEKKAQEKADLIEDGLRFLNQAATSAPDDEVVKFNYGYALFLAGKHKEAIEQLRPVLTADTRDGHAYFVLAKAAERSGDKEAANYNDNQARRYFPTYAKAQTEWQKSGSLGDIPFRLFKDFNRTEFLTATRQAETTVVASGNEQEKFLQKARELYKAGRDDEALIELRRIIASDPMNAETYLLIGNIHLRRGDLEAAVSNLKTAIFWKNDLVDGHVALGKIFLERGDFNQAAVYAKNALEIDKNNQEAIALMRQVERRQK